MIHETLLYLWHNPGNPDELTQGAKISELQEFLHPGEKKLFEHIMEIALDYHWIVAFSKKVQNQNVALNAGEGNSLQLGLYIKAFGSGIDQVLGAYRQEIVSLEEMFLKNPQLPLTYILSSLEKFRGLFQVLRNMIEMVEKDSLHGCLLMGRLHKYIFSGVDTIALSAETIIKSINTIFYRHLCNWVIYGDLIDDFSEFFIVDGKCPDEDFLYDQNPSDSSSSSLELFKKNRIRRPPVVRKFSINWNLVPIFMDEDTAESILFMGRIVWIVRNDPRKVGEDLYTIKYKRDIWEGRDTEYYRKIQNLENRSFDAVQFKSTIEECRVKLTKYLWSVMLTEGNLIQHLQLIRDFYALGRGELFQQFLNVAEKHLNGTANDYMIQNLNFIFLETARKIYGEKDESYLRFELTMSKSENTNPWAKLLLNFEINWPLHIIFHPKTMELYNKLFSFLLKVKKTQMNLQKLWQLHMFGKQKIDVRVGTLRQHLIFLVDNLQYYFQVDVIEAQFSVLLKSVRNASEFEDILKIHHEFISNLLAKTFVLTADEKFTYENKHRLHQTPAVHVNVPSKVYNVIIKLLELCDSFCLIAQTWDEELTEPEIIEFEQFQKRTNTIVESLLFILFSLHEKANGQHLLQLLYQLDFNRYFSKSKPDFNLTVTL